MVNSVLPSWICGRLFNKVQNPSSEILMREFYNGQEMWSRDLGVLSALLFSARIESLLMCCFR